MINIIEKGEIPSNTKEVRCGKCKTKFSYQQEDINPDRDGSYVVCPTCGAFIDSSLGKKPYTPTTEDFYNK